MSEIEEEQEATSVTCQSGSEMAEAYHRNALVKVAFIAVCFVLLVVSAALGMTIGERQIAFGDVFGYIWGHITGQTYPSGSKEFWDDFIIWQERMPRVAAGLLTGMGLSVAGVAMQALLKNPLADPYTTGVSSGAMMGVTIGLVLGVSTAFFSESYTLVALAFLTGIIPSLVIVGISRFKGASAATLILAGLAMSFMFGAVCQLLLLGAEAETVQETYRWMTGTLSNVTVDQIPLMSVVILAGCLFFFVATKQLNLIGTGDNSAKSLGLDVGKFRSACLIVISFMVAMSVSVVGIMGFVGLVVPHICRFFVGNDNRYVVPASMLFGGLLIVVSDIISRTVNGTGMPVGIILNFIGGPIFLILIIKQRREMW